jgi:hypothetical protein
VNGCASSIAFEDLVAWCARDLDEAAATRVEEHLFGYESCTARAARTQAIVRAIPDVVGRRGGAHLALSPAIVKRLERAGARMRHYRVSPGERVDCTVGADDDLVVTWLSADLGGLDRVDLVIARADGPVLARFDDVAISAAPGGGSLVVYSLPGDLVRTFPSASLRVQLLHGDRVAAEYLLEHTAYVPG